MKLKLVARGLLLAATPLAMQIVLASALFFTVHLVQEQAKREARNRDLLAQTYSVCIGVPELAALAMMQRQTLGLISEDVVTRQVESLSMRIKKLEDLASLDPRQKRNVTQLERGRQAIIRSLTDLPDQEKLEHDEGLKDRLLQDTSALFSVLSDMVRVEKNLLSSAPQEREFLRNAVLSVLSIWLIASLAGAYLLAQFYARSIRTPLLALAENARLLSQRKPLISLEGSDEFTELDMTLHTVDAQLRVARENESLLVENAANLICSLTADFAFISANKYSNKIIGLSEDELKGQPLSRFLLDKEFEKMQDAIEKAKQEETVYTELSILKPESQDSIETLWSVHWSPHDAQYFCIVQDITERRRTERLKEEFISMVSHDLRSPLNSVLASMQLLRAGTKGPISTAAQEEITGIESNLNWLISMVNDLLDFEKLQAGKMKFEFSECNLDELLDATLRLLQELISGKSLNIVCTNTSGCRLNVDRGRFMQLLSNLLANAIKFSPPGGNIEIAVSNFAGESIELCISDDGPGIPEDFRETIFMPFQQAPQLDSKQEGTGLGLAICRLIADGHEAELYVLPSKTGGSSFCLRLPSYVQVI